MSVILFSQQSIFQEMADAYEGLKHLLPFNSKEDDQTFYKSLRQLYFANVATYLCQYHDDTPLPEDELTSIETFAEIQGHSQPFATNLINLRNFLDAWSLLRYNLVTNNGEVYEAKEAYASINTLALRLSEAVIARLIEQQP